MSVSLRFHPAIEGDLREAADYYGTADLSLPGRLREDFKQSLDLVEAFPYLGSIIFDTYRHVTLRVFPYMVIYLITDKVVRVLALIHTRRDPVWIRSVLHNREP
ncbi:MAG: type II toxin-antitoxin system RelE/ParE family toxin [Propionibacteriaceae bacterium]|jgi:plasmid stabilization system protein ParE|nr:type II toxin-antitoxin system RelE/ParE family toxin [Propionibacteriaceae bacterium]